MPEPIKEIFRDNYTPTVHEYLNDLHRLKLKLELCNGE